MQEIFKRVSKLCGRYCLTIYHPTLNIDIPELSKHGFIQENVYLDDDDAIDCIRMIEDGMKDAIYRK